VGRLRIIDEAGSSVDKNYAAMQGLYESGILLSLNRARGENDVASVKALWGCNELVWPGRVCGQNRLLSLRAPLFQLRKNILENR
jgi:hypothetical protein